MRLLTIALAIALAMPIWAENNFDQFDSSPKTPGARPSENIALGKPYTLSPAPTYRYCTDPGDATQLTDGVYSEGYFWTQKTTVGWQNARPIIITLDLGEVRPIRGVSYHTAAGRAGVEWPLALYVLVADDDKQFHEAVELVSATAKKGMLPPQDYDTFRYWIDDLRTHGRYVAVAVWALPYAFVDEIEVYAGEAAWLDEPLEGQPVKDIKAFLDRVAIRQAVMRRLQRDIAALREQTTAAAVPDTAKEEIRASLAEVEGAMAELPIAYGAHFRAMLPLNAPHQRVFRAQAALWRAMGHAPLTVWQTPLWDPLSVTGAPQKDSAAHVHVHTMRNEYRAGAFNISNAAQETMAVALDISGLPGGTNPPYVTVHEVAWTDTNAGQPVAAALPEAVRAGGAYQLHIPSGMTRQVWLTVHTTGVAPGVHEGVIRLEYSGRQAEVPLTLHVYPLDFPEKPTLHFGGWDYTDGTGRYGVTAANRGALVAHLREHFVDSPWGTSGVLPRGTHDDAGNMTAPPNTAQFDAWLELWPGAAQYCVFASVGSTFGPWKMGTAPFNTAVQAWVSFWAAHARENGVRPEQLALLLVDEPHDPSQDAVILAWAKAIRAADTGIRVWEDPVYKDMSKAMQEMVAACHVLCPNRPIFLNAPQAYRDYFVAQRERGIALEFYSCSGPARLLDPYRYYRLQAWTCWQYEAQAMYFWAMADTASASSWNEYAAKRNAYCPLFLDDTSVTAGKQLEACREGIEDFEYLVMLRDAVARAEAKGVAQDVVKRARALLEDLPGQVCDPAKSLLFSWLEKDVDRTRADQGRIEILEILTALHAVK